MKILVVDDEPALAKSLARLLQAQGHHTTIASNGLEAWQLFEREPDDWDMLITDIRMPELDGLGLTRRVRAHGSRVRIVLISGHGEVPDIQEFSPATFLAKPFKGTALLAAMQSASP